MKRIAWLLLIIFGLMIVVSGCARWPDEPGPGPGEPEYQLEITVEVKGEINNDEGIYYIVLDADGNPVDGPRDDILFWEDSYYYIKLENGFFYFAQVEEGSPELQLTDSLYSGNKLQVIIAVSDLGDPSSVDINVITTDLVNNTYDHLDSYFTISTGFGSSKDISDSEGDSGDGGPDFDITYVTVNIVIP
ncbi:MAG: hypothetical protein IBV53_06865 [Candidatus Atribacteria bacterium]